MAVSTLHPESIDATIEAWTLARQRYEQAKSDYDDFYKTKFRPKHDEIERRAPRPDLSCSLPDGNGGILEFPLKPGELDDWCENPFYAKYVGPARERWHAYLAENARVEAETGFAAIGQRLEHLTQAFLDAEAALLKTEVPNAAELAFKICVMKVALEGCVIGQEHLDIIAADARRLAGMAVQ